MEQTDPKQESRGTRIKKRIGSELRKRGLSYLAALLFGYSLVALVWVCIRGTKLEEQAKECKERSQEDRKIETFCYDLTIPKRTEHMKPHEIENARNACDVWSSSKYDYRDFQEFFQKE